MMERIETPPHLKARITGAFYLPEVIVPRSHRAENRLTRVRRVETRSRLPEDWLYRM